MDRDERALRLAQFRLAMRLARDDLSVLARRLDDSPAWLTGEAVTEWKLAAGRYAEGRAALHEVVTLADVLHVHTVLGEAWHHLTRSDAFAFDEVPPEGPGSRDVALRARLMQLTDEPDLAGISPAQRRLERHARGAGGYAQGALYAGRADPLII